MRSRFMILAGVAASHLICFGTATADQTSAEGWRYALTTGVSVSPTYLGSDRYNLRPALAFFASKRDFFLEANPGAASAGLEIDGGLTIGALIRRRGGREDVVDPQVAALDEINGTVEAGGFIRIDVGVASVGAQIIADTGDSHGSWTTEFDISTLWSPAPQWTVSPRVAVTVAGDGFVSTYFDVTPNESVRSMLPTYEAKGGLMAVGLGVTASRAFARHWSVNAGASWNRLVADAADSPITKVTGSPNMVRGAVTVTYRF